MPYQWRTILGISVNGRLLSVITWIKLIAKKKHLLLTNKSPGFWRGSEMNIGDEVKVIAWNIKGHICDKHFQGDYIIGVKFTPLEIMYFKPNELKVIKSVYDIIADKKKTGEKDEG